MVADTVPEVNKRIETEALRHIEIDSIWRKLGKCGKYQTRHIVLMFLSFPALAWHPLTILFLGYTPEYSCNRPTNDSQYWRMSAEEGDVNITYSKCSITYVYSNQSYVNKSTCLYGYNYSIPKERSIVSEWDLVCNKEALLGLTQTLLIFGQGFGSLGAAVSDIMGRRNSYLLGQALFLGILCGTAFVETYWSFAVLRFFAGFLQMALDLIVWTSIVETIAEEQRPFIGAFGGVWWASSTVLMTPIVYLLREHSWRTMQLVLSVGSSHLIFAVFLMEESLRWLIVTDRLGPALKLVRKACTLNQVSENLILGSNAGRKTDKHDTLNGMLHDADCDDNVVQEENNYLNTTIDYEVGEKIKMNSSNPSYELGTIANTSNSNDKMSMMFKDKEILTHSVIIWFSWFVNILVYYGLFMTSAIVSEDRYLQFFLNTIIEIPGTFCSWYIMQRHGRRFGCILGHGISGVALLCSTVLSRIEVIATAVPAFITILAMIGKLGTAISFCSVYTLTPEMFPTSLRTSGMGIASFCGRASGAIVPFSDNLAKLASWLPGAIFAGFSLLVAWLLSFVPETKGRELPQTVADIQRWNRERRMRRK